MVWFLFALSLQAQIFNFGFSPTRDVLKDHEVLQNLGDLSAAPKMNFDNLKVFIWNILKGDRDGLYLDLDVLTRGNDLVLLQEAYLDEKFKYLYTKRADLDWKMAGSFRDNDGVITGVATASSQKPEKYFFLRSPDTEPVINTPKMIIASTYSIQNSNDSLLVLNIHGINFVNTDSFKRQIDQAAKVISTHVGPVLFGGDFNTWSTARMEYLKLALEKHGLSEVARPLSEELRNLDHLFQRGFEVLFANTYNQINSSDHKAIYFELKLKR